MKRPAHRPPLEPGQRRDVRIVVQVRSATAERWREAAGARHGSLAAFIREAVDASIERGAHAEAAHAEAPAVRFRAMSEDDAAQAVADLLTAQAEALTEVASNVARLPSGGATERIFSEGYEVVDCLAKNDLAGALVHALAAAAHSASVEARQRHQAS